MAIVVRQGLPSDTRAILHLTRDVWKGTDYVPRAWGTWLHDPLGCVFVAQDGGQVVGMLHVGLQDPQTAWLEGVRVGTARRSEGIAGRLLRAGVEWCVSEGCGTVRMSTSSGNEASNRMAASAGFTVIETRIPLQASPDVNTVGGAGREPVLRRAFPFEAHDVRRLLLRGDRGDRNSALYTEGWTAYELSDERVAAHCAMGNVAVALTAGAISAACIVTSSRPFAYGRVGALQGSEEGMEALARHVRRRAGSNGFDHVRATLEPTERKLALMRAAGFAHHPDMYMLVHERRLD